jgi:hypothetical protein
MASMRADLMKWTLVLWLGQCAAFVGLLSYVLPKG